MMKSSKSIILLWLSIITTIAWLCSCDKEQSKNVSKTAIGSFVYQGQTLQLYDTTLNCAYDSASVNSSTGPKWQPGYKLNLYVSNSLQSFSEIYRLQFFVRGQDVGIYNKDGAYAGGMQGVFFFNGSTALLFKGNDSTWIELTAVDKVNHKVSGKFQIKYSTFVGNSAITNGVFTNLKLE
ncbi:MAG: hypothetical protein JNK66_07750 [Chitinophagales bacterium]|nr:hypothetical protein [Chitinophagales bacterium]